MHFEAFRPLLGLLPEILALFAVIGALALLLRRNSRGRGAWDDYDRRYWADEMAYRAKMRIRSLLFGARVPRLPYFPPSPGSDHASDEPASGRRKPRAGFTAGGAAAKAALMDSNVPPTRLGRMRFRAWHRGTREADYMIGGFFDRYHEDWGEEQMRWFEDLLDHDDVDIMAWALGAQPAPDRFEGAQLELMRKLDYVRIS